MSKIGVETIFGGLTSYQYPAAYDQDQVGLGPLMVQKNDVGNEGKFVGPIPTAVIRPMEYSTAIPGVFPWAMRWSDTIDWVFLADNSTAAATRRILMATFDRTTGTFGIQGFITLTYPTATNHTIRALRMTYDLYTTGTVAVSGTAVTGTGSAWSTSRIPVGCRIGIGSTDPEQITTWYPITAVGSDTGITIGNSAGTIAGGTPYVIEDLRCVTATTNATTTNGGLYVAKGLSKDIFTVGGTTVPAAVSTDSIRAVYWLADASTVTNTVALGGGVETKTDWITQNFWVLDTIANPILFKYNIRKALTLASGKDTTTLLFKTGAGGALSGTASQANNGRVATLSHGPGSGVACLYFTTTTRVYRTADLSGITVGATNWVVDAMIEIPPGGTSSFAASSAINSVEHMGTIDKLVLALNATTTPFRSYVTQYRTDSGQFDRFFGSDVRQIDQSAASSDLTPVPSYSGAAYSVWEEGGLMYIATIGTTAVLNRVYAVPIGADWEYADDTDCCVISPRMACANIDKFVRSYLNMTEILGGDSGQNLGHAAEPVRMKYRTTGISDDSGSWTLLDDTGTLAGVAGAAYIQFRLEFRTMGLVGAMPRVHAICALYEDLSTLSNYQPSVSLSDVNNAQFSWRFATAFGSTVPDLRVRLYDAETGSELLDDDTDTPSGTFERSTNAGGAWSAWNDTDKGNEDTYLRYTPAAIGSNIKVRALLTLL